MAFPNYTATDVVARICGLEKTLSGLPETATTLSKETLLSMGVRSGSELNVDNPSAADAWPVFFQPHDDSAGFQNALVAAEEELDCYSCCPYTEEHTDRLSCARQTLWWLDCMVEDLSATIPKPASLEWVGSSYGPGHRFPGYSGTREYRKIHGHDPPTPRPEWLTFMAFCVQNTEFRHVACCVADNTSHRDSPGEALRSEIVPAVHFIRKQMELTKDISRAIPVIVFSVHHSDTARITQVWWDGVKQTINFRQSRVLNIAAESFLATDILLLVRWRACAPLREPKHAHDPGATEPPASSRPEA